MLSLYSNFIEKALLRALITRWLFWIFSRICQQTYKRIFWSFSSLIIITYGQVFTYKLYPLFPHLCYLGYGKKLGLPVCIDTCSFYSVLLDIFHTEWSNIYNLAVTASSFFKYRLTQWEFKISFVCGIICSLRCIDLIDSA